MSQTTADPNAQATIDDLQASLRRQDAEIRSLCSEVLERYEEATFVYRLAERIGTVLGEAAIAQLVLEDVGVVLGALAGAFWLRDGDAFVLVASTPRGGEGIGAWSRAEVLGVVAQGTPWVRDSRDGDETAMAVPLPHVDGAPLGVIVLRGRSAGRSYRAGEVKLATAVASLASAFIRNDRLAETARHADARKREDEIARQVHRGLLPREDPRFQGVDLSGGFKAAEVVGGDYYGYVPMADGSLGLAMADVAGHGVGAALYMATAKGAIQSEGRRILSPASLLERTNEVLLGDFSGMDLFATGVFVRLIPGGRRFVYSNAGHNPPLIVRRDGSIEKLEQGGPALGILPRARYQEEQKEFDEGDVLVVYTDGVVEARDANRCFFGIERLLAIASENRRRSGPAIRERILDELARHCGAQPPHDDVTLVIAKGAAVPGTGERT